MTDTRTIKLSDLCDLVTVQVDPRQCPDATCVGLEHLPPGLFRKTGSGIAADNLSSKHQYQTGDVLYGKLRPYLDKAVFADDAGLCTTELLVLRAKGGVDPRFLVGVVHAPTFTEYARSGVTGVHHPRTSWSHLREFELPRFTLQEQLQISNIIWQIHDAIAANETVVQCALDLRRAATQAVFSRGLRCEAQKETEIGRVPESWEVVRLGSLGRIGSGTTPDRKRSDYWRNGSIPWITSGRMYEREIKGSDVCVTPVALENLSLPMLKPGAVLIAIVGQGKTLGHCALLSVFATISRHVGYVQPNQSIVDSRYLRAFLEGQYEFLRQLASGNGSTRAALTGAILREIAVPLPPTLGEQQEIVAVLESIDERIDLHRKKRVVLDELLKTMLHKLVTGEIRVTEVELSVLNAASAAEVSA